MKEKTYLYALNILIFFFFSNISYSQLAKVLTFNIDNNNQKYFGFDCPKIGGEGTGPISITLHGDKVFIVDNYYDNIKEIDLILGKIIAITPSIGIGHKRWFHDVAVLNDKIIVASDLNLMYVFNMNLIQIDSFFVRAKPEYFQEGTKYFYWISDTLFAYNTLENITFEVCLIGNNFKLKPYHKIFHPMDFFLSSAHGKTYKVEKDGDSCIFRNELISFKLNKFVPRVECYDAINIDYDDKRMVCFDVCKNELTLFIYDYSNINRK